MKYEKFSEKQTRTLTWWMQPETADCDGIICDGAVRSGKTMSLTVGFTLWSLTKFDGQQFALCGKTIESLWRNVLVPMQGWLAGCYTIETHRGDNRLVISQGRRQNTYYLFGGKDESSYQLIQGITLAGVLFDEVALMPRSFVEQALARCSVEGSKFWFNCNPEGPGHWFFQEWIQKAEQRNMCYLHFNMEDNPNLSPAIVERYREMYSGVFYDRYVRGVWTAAEGVVYDMFDCRRHTVQSLPALTGPQYVSVDYGTQNPTVFLLWQRAETGQWICLREYYWSGRENRKQKTDLEYARAMEEFLDGIRPQCIIVDPSAASFIAQLRESGWKVERARNDVSNGIRAVGRMLGEDKLLFSADCRHTISEFRDYVWDTSAAACGEDRPRKEHDHCMDALRYFAYTVAVQEQGRVRKRPRGI